MTVFQALLCGLVYRIGVGNIPFVSLWIVQRPLVCGLITGCILGDPVTGAVVGATINLVYLGFISAGGSMPADMALAGILGTIVWYLRMTPDLIFVHMSDRYIAQGRFSMISAQVTFKTSSISARARRCAFSRLSSDF